MPPIASAGVSVEGHAGIESFTFSRYGGGNGTWTYDGNTATAVLRFTYTVAQTTVVKVSFAAVAAVDAVGAMQAVGAVGAVGAANVEHCCDCLL